MNQVEVLAIWGAVTGTIGTVAGLIGLWLRFKQHSLDKPKLVCDAYFEFDSPNHPKHKLTVRSLGRRPVIIDEIKYFITPTSSRSETLAESVTASAFIEAIPLILIFVEGTALSVIIRPLALPLN